MRFEDGKTITQMTTDQGDVVRKIESGDGTIIQRQNAEGYWENVAYSTDGRVQTAGLDLVPVAGATYVVAGAEGLAALATLVNPPIGVTISVVLAGVLYLWGRSSDGKDAAPASVPQTSAGSTSKGPFELTTTGSTGKTYRLVLDAESAKQGRVDVRVGDEWVPVSQNVSTEDFGKRYGTQTTVTPGTPVPPIQTPPSSPPPQDGPLGQTTVPGQRIDDESRSQGSTTGGYGENTPPIDGGTPPNPIPENPAADTTVMESRSKELGENLEKAGDVRKKGPGEKPYEAHHMIPTGDRRSAGVVDKIVNELGVDIGTVEKDPRFGVFLPKTDADRAVGDSSVAHTDTQRDSYFDYLNRGLEKIDSVDALYEFLKDLKNQLQNGTLDFPRKGR